jgi:hypothetical protein
MRKVFVYRNLHKKCYSVKDWKTKRVIAHVDTILLVDAKFKVSKAGRERVVREKRKNVHAGVLGYWNLKLKIDKRKVKTDVYYNPYKYESFVVLSNKQPVNEAKTVFLHKKGVLVDLKS